ncbi:adenylate/guanylate cyclase domain-containing protein [Microvirga antarctica]|uniref:adenylate/guanylate cyclase domain-containing protein n=1 Tax=Microvirga antarctica TaxID=2819233 RepID=UPI0024849A82|nr:adenylate/guanylate cyclase domain-containing protein [Microvirga antarctica]
MRPHLRMQAPLFLTSIRRIRLREIRLVSGLVLGLFLVTHFSNHALGLISLEAMETGRAVFNLLWRSWLGTVLLYGALSGHFLLALVALFRRRTLRMPVREAVQLAFGLALPFLLIPHVVGTRVDFALTGRGVGYADVVRNLWILSPDLGLKQTVALVIAWLHFCVGLYFWLRNKAWFARVGLTLYSAALLVPVLALLGFAEAGRALSEDPLRYPETPMIPGAEQVLPVVRDSLFVAISLSIAAVLAARMLRYYLRRSRRVQVTYPGGRTITILQGFSVLEGSRQAGIPHQSVCGGRGRCSTCRVRVIEGLSEQPSPTPQERATLARIDAGPNIRLACQLRPSHDLTIAPVLSANRLGPVLLASGSPAARGRERDLAVLFCDLRGFTRLTEHRLPYDTVFLLNSYFEVVGQAVESAGGHLDKFIGDGALALFGLTDTPDVASRQAFDAALRIFEGVRHLNETYASELDQPLRLALSLHVGPAIAGEMGYGHAMGLTAVGDTINAGSRLENLAKELDAELVISAELAARAGLDLTAHERRTVKIRGRNQPIDAWIITQVGDMTGAASMSNRAFRTP